MHRVCRRLLAFCWKHRVLPQIFETAMLIPLYKGKGPRHNPLKYRPIALLCVPLKILEKMMEVRLRNHLQAAGLMSPLQTGAKSGHGTRDNITVLREVIQCSEGPVHMATLDATKAFNCVDIDVLCALLKGAGVHGRFLAMVARLHASMRTHLLINGELTDAFVISNGLGSDRGLSCPPFFS